MPLGRARRVEVQSGLGKSGKQRPIKKGDVACTRTRTGKAPSSQPSSYHFISPAWTNSHTHTLPHAHARTHTLSLSLAHTLYREKARGEGERGRSGGFCLVESPQTPPRPNHGASAFFNRAPLPSPPTVEAESSLPCPLRHPPEPIPPPPPPRPRHKYRPRCHCHSPSLLELLRAHSPSLLLLCLWNLGRAGRDDEAGVVDGGAAGAAGALLRGPGRRLVPAGPAGRGVVAGGEQALRGSARAGRLRRAGPVGAGGVSAARQDGGGRHDALRRPGERRVLHRGGPRPLPPLQRQRRLPGLRIHPRLGRRRRPGVQALLLHGGRQRRQARARLGAGAQEGRAMDRGGAQALLDGPEEVRARGLAEHLAQLRDEPDADAGGQPRAEVLHPAQLRRQGQAALQHPRHHHRQHSRRRPRQQQQPLAVAALRGHGQLHPLLGAVRRARRQQAASPRPPLHAPSLRQREARGQQQRRLPRQRWPHRRRCSDADAMRPAPAPRLTTVPWSSNRPSRHRRKPGVVEGTCPWFQPAEIIHVAAHRTEREGA